MKIKNKDRQEGKGETRKRLPLFARIFYFASAISIVVSFAYIVSEPFANLFNRYIGAAIRAFLGATSGLVPFSVAEFIFIISPILVVWLAVAVSKNYSETWRDVLVSCGAILSVLSLVLTTFIWSFGAGYRTTTLDKRLGLVLEPVSAEELYNTAEILRENVEREAKEVFFVRGSSSVMPYTLGELGEKLEATYGRASTKYDFLPLMSVKLKPVMLSEPLSYTHITGIYTFFTGETNINVVFPDYTLPYTAAHELAHARGIAREDEANFIAFIVSLESEEAYVRYSAYLNLYEYVISALYRADVALYEKTVLKLSKPVRDELVAYSAFFEKYKDSVASEVSGAVNDTFLSVQGTAGSASYGMVVDLAVAYYKQ